MEKDKKKSRPALARLRRKIRRAQLNRKREHESKNPKIKEPEKKVSEIKTPVKKTSAEKKSEQKKQEHKKTVQTGAQNIRKNSGKNTVKSAVKSTGNSSEKNTEKKKPERISLLDTVRKREMERRRKEREASKESVHPGKKEPVKPVREKIPKQGPEQAEGSAVEPSEPVKTVETHISAPEEVKAVEKAVEASETAEIKPVKGPSIVSQLQEIKKESETEESKDIQETAEAEDTEKSEDEEGSEDESGKKKKKKKGIVHRIIGILEWLLIFAAAGTLVYVFVCTAQGKAASLFGYNILHVVTGSMEPTISVDDYILVKKEAMSSLEKDDIIAYYSEAKDISGKLVIHRIIQINDDGTFITMGDANPVPDENAVRPDQILGRYKGRIEFLNWIASFIDVKKLLLLAVIIPMFLASIYEVSTITKLVKKKKKLEAQEAAEKEQEEPQKESKKKSKKKGKDAEQPAEAALSKEDLEKIERWKQEAIEEYRRNHPDNE